jgi:undecaprenyl-diphosphatase
MRQATGSIRQREILTRLQRELRPEQFVRRPKLALWVGAGLIGVVVLVGLFIPAQPLAIDQRWSEAMSDIPGATLHHLALIFNYLGRGLGRALSLAAVGLVLLLKRRWRGLLAFAATEALTPLAVNILKHILNRPRPTNAMLHASGSSFPSGHAAYAGATSVALVLLFTRPGRQRLIWWSLAALATAGMAWSRTYLQLHWLSDVVSGGLLGIGVTLVSFALIQLIPRNSPKTENREQLPPDAASLR